MRTLRRSAGQFGRVPVLWTLDEGDDRTVSVQIDDVVLSSEPAVPLSGPLDADRR